MFASLRNCAIESVFGMKIKVTKASLHKKNYKMIDNGDRNLTRA